MVIRNIKTLGQYIAYRRKQLCWSQRELAERVSTTQAWVSSLEQGKPGVGVGQVLRVLAELDLRVDIYNPSERAPKREKVGEDDLDLNVYVDSGRFTDTP